MAKGRVAYAGRARLCIVGLFAAVLLQVPALHAENDDYSHFERAKNAFDAGEYKEAVSRFDALLKKQPKNAALVLECHKFIAVSYLFVGDKVAAEHHLTELLTITPDYDLDPMMFPMEIVDFFQEMKTKNKKQLDALSLARAREEAQRKATEEAQRKAELEKLKRNVYLERTRKKNSRLVAVVPFGAGQFQNGHIVKGALFLSGEILLVASAVTTYFLHASLRDQAEEPFKSSSKREQAENLELGYRIANHASLVALGSLMIAGLIDALVYYKPETVVWKQIEQKEVPKHLRPGGGNLGATLRPRISLGQEMIGVGLHGRF